MKKEEEVQNKVQSFWAEFFFSQFFFISKKKQKSVEEKSFLSSGHGEKFLIFHQNIAEVVEFLDEVSFKLFGAFAERWVAVIVVATVVEDLCHVFDVVSEASVIAIHDFRFDGFEIWW